MFPFLARFRRASSTRTDAPSYEVVCVCETRLTGRRAAAHQVVRCPNCGRDNFVLAWSPLPPVAPEHATATPRPPVPGQRSVFLLALVGVVLLLGAGGGYLLFRLVLPMASSDSDAPALLERHRARGQTALGDGNFQVAAVELRAALTITQRTSTKVTPAELRQLTQLHRQAALLADLLHEPLSVLLQLAAGVPDQEWHAVFTRNYHGKAVVFDAEVRRLADGRYEISHVVWDGRAAAPLQLDDVALLNQLPLETAHRLIFGVRLAGIQREPTGQWRVRLQPESGVLLTDRAAVEACLFLPADESLQLVLERQAGWVQERP